MDATKLMLGDFIKTTDNDGWDEKFRNKTCMVIGLRDEDGAIKCDLTDDFNCYVWSEFEDDFEPIPLTPEILEKNGAHKNKLMGEQRHFEYWIDGFTMLAIYDADFSFQINGGARKIKYVHELQHALRLCGIEKEIVL